MPIDFFEKRLRDLECQGLLRTVKDKSTPQGPRIIIEGKELINFASNDYLGFASNELLKEASLSAISHYGTGAGASRLLGGGTELHKALEKRIASFKDTPKALLLNSGYIANVVSIACLMEEGDYIFSDELNHASIIDGCRLSRARVFIYSHKDTGHLEELLYSIKNEGGRRLIVTDSVFSMDGDIAPVPDLLRIAERYNALLYIDDAHATGVLGGGHGSLKHFGLSHRPYIIQMGTFSKALGSFGAFVAAEESIIDWLINKARGFIYSTCLPPSVVGASLKALELIEKDKSPIERLWKNRDLAIKIIKDAGLEIGPSETPIIPVLFKNIEDCLNFSSRLFDKGIYAPAIRPPTVQVPRLRFTITAAHSEEDLEHLHRAIKEIK